MSNDAAFEDWLHRAKSADIKEVAEQLGAKLKRTGHEFAGHCPAGCTTNGNGFSVNPKKGVFLCRPGGASGSVIDLAMHIAGGDFMQACEVINGEPPPRGESKPIDPEIARERERQRVERERRRVEQEREESKRKRSSAEMWWERSIPIEGTYAQAYLRARGLDPRPSQTINLGFIPNAPLYTGSLDEEGRPISVGRFPCMVAAMRDLEGNITACHRTYLDPEQPRKLQHESLAKAKKVIGEAGGGVIWLGEPVSTIACGEGVETTLAYGQLWQGGEIGLCAAYSLGNMAGASTDTRPHPDAKKKSTIPNGVPDLTRPGMLLPPVVQEIILLGDGDSDPAVTRAHLLTAGRRFMALGARPMVSMAPAGSDWNDALLYALQRVEQGEAA